jgi:hypothetical protein
MHDSYEDIVWVSVNDPWEFQDENNGASGFQGWIENANDQALLVHSSTPVRMGGRTFEHFLVTARHQGAPLAEFADGLSVPCNGIAVPPDRLAEAKRLNTAWWRGGGGLIGTIRLKP